MVMEVEIISEETIKPSSPTPDDLRTFKLALLDQLQPPVFSKLVYFYPPSAAAAGYQEAEVVARSVQLKASLSQVLTRFYPFAGRGKDNLSVECNDDGAIYVKARVRSSLADVLKEPADEVVRQFLPINFAIDDTGSGCPLLLVQASFFDCGGLAIGLLISHKLADAATIVTFVNTWTAVACGSGKAVHQPELLTAASLFPPKGFLANLKMPTGTSEKISTKRFVFAASSIALLKSKAVSSSNQQQLPTRVEAVSALIWKCVTRASRSNSPTKKRQSVLFQSVNLRKRFNPPLPENSIGNLVGYYSVDSSDEDSEIELHRSVEGLKRGLAEFCDGYVNKLQGKEGSSAILERMKLFDRRDACTITVTSWCRFSVRDADFGWGKPVWVSTTYMPFPNVVVLMDSSDGAGIEAWMSLKDEDMAVFERDEDLLAYASPNPLVSNSLFGTWVSEEEESVPFPLRKEKEREVEERDNREK